MTRSLMDMAVFSTCTLLVAAGIVVLIVGIVLLTEYP